MSKQDDLLVQCWAIFDHFMSRDYQGATDETHGRLINGMYNTIQEIGRPDPPPSLGISVSDGLETKDEVR